MVDRQRAIEAALANRSALAARVARVVGKGWMSRLAHDNPAPGLSVRLTGKVTASSAPRAAPAARNRRGQVPTERHSTKGE
jgi:hypothetical protein